MSIRRTKMTKRFNLALIALVALVMLILPASASFLVVDQGKDVFIGEEGLNVANAVDGFAQIAWFASGTTPQIDTPNYILSVGNPASFYVSPADFVGKTGNWYPGTEPTRALHSTWLIPALTSRYGTRMPRRM